MNPGQTQGAPVPSALSIPAPELTSLSLTTLCSPAGSVHRNCRFRPRQPLLNLISRPCKGLPGRTAGWGSRAGGDLPGQPTAETGPCTAWEGLCTAPQPQRPLLRQGCGLVGALAARASCLLRLKPEALVPPSCPFPGTGLQQKAAPSSWGLWTWERGALSLHRGPQLQAVAPLDQRKPSSPPSQSPGRRSPISCCPVSTTETPIPCGLCMCSERRQLGESASRTHC